MKFSHFFIDRPIFAAVISILITLVGAVAYLGLPVTQYPEIVPPSVVVSANYPGASPEIIKNTVSQPLEESINGVEDMIYMQSQCSSDGSMQITVTFKTGTDVDSAQILVQNRVSWAESRLPEEVRSIGVTVKKRSPDIILMIALISPDGSRDKLYLTNYALTQLKDRLARVEGVGEIQILGAKEYSMRIWMDPDRLAYLDLSPSDVIAALREQNKQIAAGKLNQPPLSTGAAYELIINAQGRLEDPKQFEDIIVKYTPDGRIVRVKDVARVELGSYTYSDESYLNGNPMVSIAAYQLPGSNGLDTARRLRAAMDELAPTLPNGVSYNIPFDTTTYIQESVNAVYHTIFEAVLLVVFVVMVFLQNWRAAVIPLFAIPVSLIGTFAAMAALGFTINNLSLFGLVLAIGIVVDDAIVVVENVERNMHEGLGVREATKKAMTQVQGALIAIAMVLAAVFLPTAIFIEGISGQFYKQFAITIAASTVFSAIVSLTLSPALCAIFLRDGDAKPDWFTKIWNGLFGWFFRLFNRGFEKLSSAYGRLIAVLARFAVIVLVLYCGLLGSAKWFFDNTATGFIPKQDTGYLFTMVQLPDGASFERTNEVVRHAAEIIGGIDGVKDTIAIAGLSGATFSRASNAGAIFINLKDKKEREKAHRTADVIMMEANMKLAGRINEAVVVVLAPPPVNGLGMGGDFKFFVQDKTGRGLAELQRYTQLMAEEASKLESVSSAFTTYRISNPQLYVDINRERAQKLNVPIASIFNAMQYQLGSIYVNDFNIVGRVYRVVAQAESSSRRDPNDIYNLKVQNAQGRNVPLGSLVDVKRVIGPSGVISYNVYNAAEVMGNLTPGYSTGQAINAIEELAQKVLPQGMGIEWTDIAFQEKVAGNTATATFAMCTVFVFLLLAALYESWTMPLAVILVVPLVLLFAIMGVHFRGMDNNIMTQIGFIVLIGLACKNAILIVEFANQRQMRGEELLSSVRNASKNRLRPILMTSLAFIGGVIPLAYAAGSGAELRQALGTSVLFGMIGVTVFGCLFTPVFYYVLRRVFGNPKASADETKA